MDNQKTHIIEESFLQIYQLFLFKVIRDQSKQGHILRFCRSPGKQKGLNRRANKEGQK
jgi:hypothetical protein